MWKLYVTRFALAACLIGAAQPVNAQADPPLVAETKAGPCRMTVSGEGSAFLIVVTGLRANEPLKATSTSEDEVASSETKADADGRYSTIVIPLVKGKSFGTASFEVIGQRCRIEASYPWKE